MTTKDVLALALEALELSSITVDNFTVQAKCQDAITAIKQAQQAQEPVGINGLTEAETSASMSVMGLSKQAPKQAEPSELIEIMCARIKAADDACADMDYMLDSNDCIKVIRGEWRGPVAQDHPPTPPEAK